MPKSRSELRKNAAADSTPLRLELRDFANIVQNATEAILIYESRKIIFANHKALEMSGMTESEFIGSDILDFIPIQDIPAISERITQRESGAKANERYELSVIDIHGEPKYCWISSNAIVIDGKTCVLCFITDVSEQRNSRVALQQSEAKYRQLIEEAYDAILLSDQDGNFFDVNSRATQIFGYTKEEFLQMNIRELIQSKDMNLKPLRLVELVDGKVVTTQRALRRKDGSEFTAEVGGKVLPDGTIQGTVRDLSERRDAEKRLRLVVEGTSYVIGEDFLTDLVKSLAQALEVKYVLITENHADDESLSHPLRLWDQDHYTELPPYKVNGTPYEKIRANHKLLISHKANTDFPKDVWMKSHHIVSYIGLPLLDSHNQFIGHLAVMDTKPISDIILAESIMRIFGARAGAELERRSLEKMWRRYEFIINASRDLNSLIGRDFRYEAVNDAFCESNNLSRPEVIGQKVTDIWGNEAFNDVIKPHLETCFQGYEFHEQEWIQPASYSSPGFFDISYYPYYDNDGNVTHAIVISRDITDRKRAEMDLQYRLEFEKLITSLSTRFINLTNAEIDQGIKVALQEIGEFTGVDSCFIFMSDGEDETMKFQQQWQNNSKPSYLKKWNKINFMDFAWAAKLLETQHTVVIQSPEELPVEETKLKKLLQEVAVHSLILVPITFRHQLRGLVGFAIETEGKTLLPNADYILHIISELFSNALERKESVERLNQIYEMQSNLFSSIAHSLKTPFSVVLGNINVLERDSQQQDAETTELLEGIKLSVSQANEKVSQLLKVAQLDMSPNHSAPREVIDLDSTLTTIVNQAKYLFQAYNTGVSREEIDSHVRFFPNSAAKIDADTKSISDLVLTLLDNAFKHSPKANQLPQVTVKTYRRHKNVIIEIADNGKGIAKKHLQQIFDLYYQVDKNRGGFGIGLAFCKKLAETLGGSISVASQVNKGTIFKITLPIKE